MPQRNTHRRAPAYALALALGACLLAPPPPAAHGAPPGGKPKLTKKERKAAKRKAIRKKNRKQKRPNVIVITTDDQNESMLGLDATARLLGGAGTTFRNSYVSYPLCCPSRATFLTGQYAHNHGVISTELPNGYGAFNHTNNLAVWLRKSGYATGMVGKYLNGYGIDDGIPEPLPDAREVPPGWTEWFGLTGGLEQRRYKYFINENGKIRYYGRGGKNYVTDVLAKKAVHFVGQRAKFKKPFFLWFNPTAPHGEAGVFPGATRDPQPAIRHMGRFEYSFAPRTPNFNEDDVSDKPLSIQNTPKLTTEEIADIDRRHRGRMESLLSVDEAIPRIWKKVRQAGDKRKTYVFFTSDNGLLLGAHRLTFKHHIYEESTRVPLIVRGPKFPRGAVRDQPVSNVDLAPTIAQLTKIRPGLVMDGRSLLGPAKNASVGAGREVLFESEVQGGSVGVRRGDFVLIEHGVPESPELYDLRNDPFQLQSLHASPAHQAIRDQLSARIAQLRSCAGASCP